jgi:SAM-dependent methyltransferase
MLSDQFWRLAAESGHKAPRRVSWIAFAAAQNPSRVECLGKAKMEKIIHRPVLLLFLFAVSTVLIWLVYWLFILYRDERRGTRWLENLEIDPLTLGGFRYSTLVLISMLSLFLEMMMIRWVSSEIRVFAYFKNLVLLACFLGFGLGCYLCRRRVQLVAMMAPLLMLTILLKTPLSPLREIIVALPEMLGGGTEVHMWGVPAMPASWSGTLLALAVMVPLFAVIAMAFVPAGQLVGWYLEKAPNGVTAYTVNVLASLAGIGGYTLLCFLYQPPAAWMAVAGLLSVLSFWRKPQARWLLGTCFLACVLLLSIRDHRRTNTYWSPYQKLDLRANYENGQIFSYTLNTNDTWYQQIVDLSQRFVESHPEAFRERPPEWMAYNLPYRFYPDPPSVLVLGAGMGNDVAAALRNGASRVVAVEIDPLILKLGRQLHFEHPYQSSRTRVVVDDARSYMENSNDKFDLIVFSLLDSHTTASYFSNIRIDNFVYTREALARARQLLKPDGLFVVKFQVGTPWIVGRLHALMKDTFGDEPLQFQVETTGYDTGGHFFVSGSGQRIGRAMADPSLADFVAGHAGMPMEPARVTTDDWPFFYQHEPGLPISVILVSLAVLLTFGWFLRQTGGTKGGVDLHFLLLGAGFMLLESQIVSRMALLFGTTWMVNSIVVSGLLLLVVAANLTYEWVPKIPVRAAYAGLFASLAASYIVPIEKLFFEAFALRAVVSTLVLCLPVFFAGIIFVSSFADAHFRGSALGSNLFGAMAGGLLESLSLWFGLRSITLLAAIIYAGSALVLLLRRRRGGIGASPAISEECEKAAR